MSMFTQILKPIGVYDAFGTAIGSTAGGLNVAIVSGSINVGTTDKTVYTYGSSIFLAVGGVYQDTAASLTAGQSGAFRLTSARGVHTNLRDSSGAELLGQALMAGSIPVVLSSDQSTIAISAASLPLPAGASTSALQSQISAQLPASLGQKVMASSLAVSIASDQSTLPVSAASLPLPSGAATSANQATEITALGTISGQLPTTLGQKVMASSMSVTVASDQSTLPVSGTITVTGVATAANQTNGNQITQVSVLPALAAGSNNIGSITNITGTVSLPTGAATSALQSTINTTLGSPFQAGGSIGNTSFIATQATAANLNATVVGTVTANAGTGTFAISAASLPLPTGASTAANQTNVQSAPGTSATTALTIQGSASGVAVPVSGTVTITPSGTQAVNMTQVGGSAIALGQTTMSASMPVTIASNQSALAISAASLPLPTGAATSALQTTISGQLPTTLGQKTSANSMAVVLASDQSAISTSQKGRSTANAPVYNAYASTNITTGAYVQLVASTSLAINYLDIFDSSGQAMIIGVGAPGSEVIQGYVAPGGDQIPLAIPAGSRIALKALTANATAGYLLFNMYT